MYDECIKNLRHDHHPLEIIAKAIEMCDHHNDIWFENEVDK
jgi:hypothetical protein